MSRIKGRYVAQAVIEIDVDENEPDLKPIDQLRDDFVSQMTEEVKDTLIDDFGTPFSTVTVEKQFADIWRAGDE